MPIYLYKNLGTGEIKEVLQNMDEEHIYIENGIMFERVFTTPQTVIDSIYNINPRSSQEFVRKTGLRKGKLNDLFQLSAELSEKRKSKDGIDYIERKSWDNYEKSRVKTKHPQRLKQELTAKIKKLGADIEL